MDATPTYEIFAMRYAVLKERERHENFISADPHDGPMPLDYFIWAIVGAGRTIVVDTGFGAAEAERRGRELLCLPKDALAQIGIEAATVEDVIITHLHYDHAGTSADFPHARFHLQDLEMQFATGRYMRHEAMRHAFSVDDVVEIVRRVYDGRVVFHDGDDESLAMLLKSWGRCVCSNLAVLSRWSCGVMTRHRGDLNVRVFCVNST